MGGGDYNRNQVPSVDIGFKPDGSSARVVEADGVGRSPNVVSRGSVQMADDSLEVSRVPQEGLRSRLSSCAPVFKRWNSGMTKAAGKDIKDKKRELAEANMVGDGGIIDWRHVQRLDGDLDGMLKEEEAFWCQRSRVSWLQGGDQNTKFFHAKASSRKRRNCIQGLFDDEGIWRDNEEDMVGIVDRYFSGLFQSSRLDSDQLRGCLWCCSS
ncbi:hypothetical protein LWI29_024324 [Acer saccharum]|uniref:Uncharacterized protein n=1 Tax=Acer saccharum TaxID=4024 RepID=A0AA39SWW7_ACESA|nr:hypothetical protein LWI29_024324 [Acer saccharum]